FTAKTKRPRIGGFLADTHTMRCLALFLFGLLVAVACTSSGGAAVPEASLTTGQECATAGPREMTKTPDVSEESTSAAQGTPYELILCAHSVTFTPECVETLTAFVATITPKADGTVEARESPDCY